MRPRVWAGIRRSRSCAFGEQTEYDESRCVERHGNLQVCGRAPAELSRGRFGENLTYQQAMHRCDETSRRAHHMTSTLTSLYLVNINLATTVLTC